jgi:hypothetical protein
MPANGHRPVPGSNIGYLHCHPPKGFTIVGHSPSLTCFPGRTRNSFELILIFILSVMPAALFASVYL